MNSTILMMYYLVGGAVMLIFVVINVMEPRFTNPNNSVKKKGTLGIF